MEQHKKTVLVVEDNKDIRETIKEFLEIEGFNVVVASNGKEGLERLAEIHCPCLIILDMFMPVMDGAQFLTEIHTRHSQHSDKVFSIPVALLSAAPSSHDKLISTKPLVQAYIKKPIDLIGFLNTVKQYCA